MLVLERWKGRGERGGRGEGGEGLGGGGGGGCGNSCYVGVILWEGLKMKVKAYAGKRA